MYLLRTTQKTVFIGGIIASLAIGFIVGNIWSPLAQHGKATLLPSEISSPTNNPSTSQELNFTLLNQSWNKIKNNFYFKDKIDAQEAVYGASYGLIDSLNDPYTVFFSPEESTRFRDSLDGSLEGIGAELGMFDGALTVTGVIKDSPAFKAGLKAKDIIYSINDESTASLSLGEAVSKIRGPRGSEVSLTISHDGQKTTSKITITRDIINIKEIDLEMLPDDIAFIRINQFAEDTRKELTKLGQELVAKKPKGIILDLRWNPGGFLESAVDVVSFFLKKGVAVKKIMRTDHTSMSVDGNAMFGDIPLVILVNSSSASASEIVAGALRDNNRAKLIGEKTFGKGTIQEMHTLPNGASLKITVGKWFPPSGEDIDHKGITPEIEIKLDQEAFTKGRDNQKDKAVEEMKKVLTQIGARDDN
ncbi:MAG: S41 family peptidase [Candidatus Abawacabacteria bacterium]|nr:S41 family peptidase [Candidatus Abawacabacteria bacterium]